MRTVYQTLYSQAGNQIEVLDYKLLQAELQTLESIDIGMQATISDLGMKIAKLTNDMVVVNDFMKFCAEQRPEALTAYMAMLRAKDRIGVTK